MVSIALLAGTIRPVALPVVAESEGIPEQFLDQIVSKLRKAGFVKSVRGVNGGYMLNRPASEISIGALVRLLEGSLAPIGCVSEDQVSGESYCDRFGRCHTRNIWVRVMDAVAQALDALSLADVMADEVDGKPSPLSVLT